MSAVFPKRLLSDREVPALPTISLPDVIAYLQRHPDTSFFYYATYSGGEYVVKGYFDSAEGIPRMKFVGCYSGAKCSVLPSATYFAFMEGDDRFMPFVPMFRYMQFRVTHTVFEPPGYTSTQPKGYADDDYARGISPLSLPTAAIASPVGFRISSFRYTWQRRRRRKHRRDDLVRPAGISIRHTHPAQSAGWEVHEPKARASKVPD